MECRIEAFLWIRAKSAESDHVSLDDHIGITSTHARSIDQTEWTIFVMKAQPTKDGSIFYKEIDLWTPVAPFPTSVIRLIFLNPSQI